MNTTSLDLSAEYTARIALARSHFFQGENLPHGVLSDAIERSWRRCLSLGLTPATPADLSLVTARELREIRERSRVLLEVAQPELENLYQQIANTGSVVILTDAEATVLASISRDDPLTRRGGRPGMCWQEQRMGTNAIGTVIVEQQAVTVLGREHYLDQNGPFSCSASPVFDPFGKLIGVLDISGGNSVHQNHIQDLASMSAQVIENRLILTQLGMHTVVRFHSRPEFLGTLWEAIAAFSHNGTLVAANRAALTLLEIGRDHFHRHDFSSLFDYSFDRFQDQFSVAGRSPQLLYFRSGMRVYASASPISTAAGRSVCGSSGHSSSVLSSDGSIRRSDLCLADIALGEAPLHDLLEKARLAFSADIPILLQGETGSGKEALAKALHFASPRKSGPFVPINCASIPETLIESELFGYADGAFTGAKRGGAVGKVQLSDKGTLFLDEIGDMPLSLQARLLRVLQEREVAPVGSTKLIPVDIGVICATHMNLKELIAQNRFREDLYYRLNGLKVLLPPLRQRQNLREIICHIVASKSTARGKLSVSDEAMDAFLKHPWPGNMRQLCNVVSTAMVLLGNGKQIELQHLTDDFLNEMIGRRIAGGAEKTETIHTGTLTSLEAQAVQRALERHGGNISVTAAALGISRATLYRKIKHYLPGTRND
ncbi:MAG TPA: sigma-54-dependent Fis family transcriptional regulator [Rhodocyclaceae bacterium]|nr:sigma-54-dependent Fis family transcriptional regulator [Rhodocyclaceae bacterium]